MKFEVGDTVIRITYDSNYSLVRIGTVWEVDFVSPKLGHIMLKGLNSHFNPRYFRKLTPLELAMR